jgi:enoyl-CoA hydratase/carnithine racemase
VVVAPNVCRGFTLSPVEAAQRGFVHEAVPGKALDRAMEIAMRLASHTPQSIRHIKRLIRNAVETPLDRGLQLERNLFMDLCGGDEAIARMRAYESKRVTDPAQGLRL